MNKKTTEQMIAKVENYFNLRKDRPGKCTDNDMCNANFTINDSRLADVASAIAGYISSGQVYSFNCGVSAHGDNSKLRMRVCDCPGKNNPYTKRNEIRSATEKQLDKWLKSAKKWIADGAIVEIQEKPIVKQQTKGEKPKIKIRGIK